MYKKYVPQIQMDQNYEQTNSTMLVKLNYSLLTGRRHRNQTWKQTF